MCVIMTQIFTRTMPFTHEDKGFIEIYRPDCIAPNSADLSSVDYADDELCSSACITFRFLAYTISRTECAPAGRNVHQQITEKSVGHWRDKLNGGYIDSSFDYLVHLLP